MRTLISTLALASLLAPASDVAARQVPPAAAGMQTAVAELQTTAGQLQTTAGQLQTTAGRLQTTAGRQGATLARFPVAGWAPQDPADSLWRVARLALDRGENAAAAAAYRRIRTEARFSSSAYRAHAFYWEAFARQRIGSTPELRTARDILDELERRHPDFENMAEARRLQARIHGDLASRGDAQSASQAAAMVAAVGAPQRPPAAPAPPPARAPTAPRIPPAPPAGRGRTTVPAHCPDQELRAAAVESLLNMPAEHAMPILEQVMARKDECNARLREIAIFMIAQKGGSSAEDILLDAARSDPNPTVREQSVFWLSRVNSEKAVDALQEILRTSPDPKMLEQAVFALSQHRSPRASQLLRDIASRPGAAIDTRKKAIFWLGQRGDADTGNFLRGIYGSTADAGMKEAVIHALSQRRGENNADWLLEIAMSPREPMEARKQALFWAGQQATLPLGRLAELYTSMPSREMKEQIVFTLSQRREPDAIDRLIEIARREQDPQLRRNVLFWLGQSRDPRAARFLAEIIGG